jgi:hypothetical protein
MIEFGIVCLLPLEDFEDPEDLEDLGSPRPPAAFFHGTPQIS